MGHSAARPRKVHPFNPFETAVDPELYDPSKYEDAAEVGPEEFEAAALEWFTASLETAKAVRPRALWGFYGFPKVEMWVEGWEALALQQQPWPSWCKKESGVEPSGVDFTAFRITTNPNANHR